MWPDQDVPRTRRTSRKPVVRTPWRVGGGKHGGEAGPPPLAARRFDRERGRRCARRSTPLRTSARTSLDSLARVELMSATKSATRSTSRSGVHGDDDRRDLERLVARGARAGGAHIRTPVGAALARHLARALVFYALTSGGAVMVLGGGRGANTAKG